MKRAIVLFLSLLIGLTAPAQQKVLDRIKATNSAVKSFDSDVHNTLVKAGKTTEQDGKLYYAKPYQFAAYFETDNHIIVNESRMKIDMGILHGKFKLGNGLMRSLSNVFLYGFQGRCQELAQDNDYDMAIKQEGTVYIVTFTTKKKKLIGLGYKQVFFKFGLHDLLIKEIKLIDYNDVVDCYSISNTNYNVKVSNDRFTF